jgi:outer membrane protein TolC
MRNPIDVYFDRQLAKARKDLANPAVDANKEALKAATKFVVVGVVATVTFTILNKVLFEVDLDTDN